MTSKRVALVSGGSKGLGRGIVEELLAQGYCVATFSRKSNSFIDQQMSADAEGKRFIWRSVDATDREGIKAFAREVASTLGQIDVLVNNAGIGIEGMLTSMSDDDIENGLAMNLESTIILTRACLKSMLLNKGGVVINISSVNALKGHKGLSVYSATKAALNGLAISLAREYGSQGIRVNNVAPGFFESDMSTHLSEAQIGRIMRRTPLKRLCSISDIVNTVVFLIDNSSITGQTVAVDCGFVC